MQNILEFEKHHAPFHNRYGGFSPHFLKRWFKKVNSSHEKIRQLLNGVRYKNCFQIESSQNDVPYSAISAIADRIEEIVPLETSGLKITKEDFIRPTLEVGTHRVYRIPKLLKDLFKANHGSDEKKLSAELDKLLSDLGSIWAKGKTSSSNLEITISTSHMGFVLLGHYGPDKDSCFRSGSDKDSHKFAWGQTEDSFVVTISKYDEVFRRNVNVARCLGILKNGSFYIFNYYFARYFNEGDAISVITRALEDITKSKIFFSEGKIGSVEGVFFNPYPNWCFSQSEKAQVAYIQADTNLILTYTCEKCRSSVSYIDYLSEIDDIVACSSCTKHANISDLSGSKTFGDLVKANIDGLSLMITEEEAAQYKRCPVCECASDHLIVVNGSPMCKECEEIGFSTCDICDKYVRDTDIEIIENYDVCPSCSSSVERIEDMIDANI